MATINNRILNNLKSHDRTTMENAFNIIYSEYSYLLFYVSLQIVRNNEIAKEMTNEAFLKFYENKDSIRRADGIKYYLVSTCKNLSINYIKSNKNYAPLEDNEIEVEDKYDDYASYLKKFETFLNKEELDLVVYHLIYDYSFNEIAKELNVSINVVTSKYKRTLDKIKSHYKE